MLKNNILRFYIDRDGYVRISQRLYPNVDNSYFYNLTLSATDSNNRKIFCNLVVYLNVTSVVNSNNFFECAIIGAKSEIDLIDKFTLNPPLFIMVILTF